MCLFLLQSDSVVVVVVVVTVAVSYGKKSKFLLLTSVDIVETVHISTWNTVCTV